ncbi:UDP-N-acetylglucosamine 2-epimerase [Nisaea denitrificans]|uniref:UDP-N-acetylglucosamine 2-epimerase n=1 Tax=Nisaea denitrificans TaxID=390877 RepID=UPI00040E7C34|nr:UDP-N-acetylglucosamine 2-epimerase [Nisaea denitrificans]
MKRQTIAGVTGSRADFGIQKPVLEAILAEPDFALDLYVTGMHLSPRFGNTVDEVEAAGFEIAGRIDCETTGGSHEDVALSTSAGMAGFTRAWSGKRPDLVLLLGDRFETFAAASAAYLLNIPIAHIAGGDVTSGSLDDGLRHAISKFSNLHFTTNEEASARLIRMGEDPATVLTTGSPALDSILTLDLLSRDEVERRVGAPLGKHLLVVTFHPATADKGSPVEQFGELLAALEDLPTDHVSLVTYANADTGGAALNLALEEAALSSSRILARESLGQMLYLSALRHASMVVGNSSSGLYEAPSFGIPTVNIGTRQDGRIRATSVVDCLPERDAITAAIHRASAMDCSNTVNPYGDGRATERTIARLRTAAPFVGVGMKRYHDPL